MLNYEYEENNILEASSSKVAVAGWNPSEKKKSFTFLWLLMFVDFFSWLIECTYIRNVIGAQ